MSSPQPPQAVCKWCGEKLAEGAEQCPLCKRPVAGSLRPIGDAAGSRPSPGIANPSRSAPPPTPRWERPRDREPVAPAPGQEEFGSWASIRHIFRADKVFASLLVLLSLGVFFNVLGQNWFGVILGGAVLWGIVTFQWWGFWLAIIGAGLGALMSLVMFIALAAAGTGFAVFAAPSFLIDAFVLIVLLTRRDRFD
jgi:hypothetical protein